MDEEDKIHIYKGIFMILPLLFFMVLFDTQLERFRELIGAILLFQLGIFFIAGVAELFYALGFMHKNEDEDKICLTKEMYQRILEYEQQKAQMENENRGKELDK
ncbi:MAG: hypothetical protein FIB08_11290 [Candidatus Methanoperedens sp.]|nr:hypothetical protein [Candidatus Methanoperedens sp.]